MEPDASQGKSGMFTVKHIIVAEGRTIITNCADAAEAVAAEADAWRRGGDWDCVYIYDADGVEMREFSGQLYYLDDYYEAVEAHCDALEASWQ